jgi:small multidrug resistance pump
VVIGASQAASGEHGDTECGQRNDQPFPGLEDRVSQANASDWNVGIDYATDVDKGTKRERGMPAWLLLIGAIVMEVVGTTALKLSDGFTRLVPSLVVVAGYALAFIGLGLVLKRMEVSVAYAIWAGLGTALVALVGVFLFGETMNWVKAGSLGLIVVGLIGLNLAGGS